MCCRSSRKVAPCEIQLILTIYDLAAEHVEGDQTDAVLLDFSKAFDLKLHHYGIRGTDIPMVQQPLH